MTTCEECGAPLPAGGACIDHFHAMLALENEYIHDPVANAGNDGEVAHFYAVASYNLQHPEGQRLTVEALAGLREALANHLAGRMTLEEIRWSTRRAANGPSRVLRRTGDPVRHWHVEIWPTHVADVLEGGVPDYARRVAAWATSVVRTLDVGD